MYSEMREDYFYTTVPQMAAAASWGSLQPIYKFNTDTRYDSAAGSAITGYGSFPDGYPGVVPQAAVWVFTTPENPKNAAIPLAPLYRMSWKCGDPTPYPPANCSASWPLYFRTDTLMTADPAGISYFEGWGYKLDGIEGYIYPKDMPQPTGTVRLMRKYHPARDDHATFPETQLAFYTAAGYTQDSGSDWLGYVYPNTTGAVPAIP